VEETTEKLSAAMAAGDEGAVEIFYRRYFDWLYAQARRASRRDESFCLDVVQDAVLRVIRTVRVVKSEVQFRAWLRLVVQTTACDKLRSESRRLRRESAVARPVVECADEPSDMAQHDWLRRQIAQLDPQLARLMELRFGQGLTLRRIAAGLGLSVGTVDGRLRRALGQLRLGAFEEFDG
jgi:RNA polymerase sigma factor (sigma-70 family)